LSAAGGTSSKLPYLLRGGKNTILRVNTQN